MNNANPARRWTNLLATDPDVVISSEIQHQLLRRGRLFRIRHVNLTKGA